MFDFYSKFFHYPNMYVSVTKYGKVFGIRIASEDYKKFFSPTWQEIECEVDGAYIRLPVPHHFHNGRYEFRGGKISQWLVRNGQTNWMPCVPLAVQLEPLGGNRFRLFC